MSGVALRLVRLDAGAPPGDVEEALAVERRYTAKEARGEYIARGLLFDFDEQWVGPHAALTGGSNDSASPGYQPVLGGSFVGRTATEVVVLLAADRVAAAAEYLGGLDILAVVAGNLDAAEAVAYVVPGEIEDSLEQLRTFYLGAADAGDAVLKVALS